MRTVSLLWRRAGAAWVVAAVAAAQTIPFTYHPVPGGNAFAIGVLWQAGYHQPEPAGQAAGVLAACRLARGRLAAPACLASGAQAAADHAVVWGVFPLAGGAAAIAFLQALLDDSLPLADDAIVVEVARQALAADDAMHLFPGAVATTRARAHFGGAAPWGKPQLGEPQFLAALTPGEVRAMLRQPVPRRGLGLGALPAVLAQQWPARGAPRGRVAAAPSPAVGRALASEVHSRVDAPFVAAAFLVPGELDPAVVAVAVEVARERANRSYRRRGAVLVARAPYVAWSWPAGDPLVVFHRRGADPVQLLPGQVAEADAAAELRATVAEVHSLLAALRETPPSAAECAAAQRRVLADLGLLEPLRGLDAEGATAVLPGRLLALLVAEFAGIEAVAVQAVAPPAVAAAWSRLLQPEAACWQALLPAPRADRGFVAR